MSWTFWFFLALALVAGGAAVALWVLYLDSRKTVPASGSGTGVTSVWAYPYSQATSHAWVSDSGLALTWPQTRLVDYDLLAVPSGPNLTPFLGETAWLLGVVPDVQPLQLTDSLACSSLTPGWTALQVPLLDQATEDLDWPAGEPQFHFFDGSYHWAWYSTAETGSQLWRRALHQWTRQINRPELVLSDVQMATGPLQSVFFALLDTSQKLHLCANWNGSDDFYYDFYVHQPSNIQRIHALSVQDDYISVLLTARGLENTFAAGLWRYSFVDATWVDDKFFVDWGLAVVGHNATEFFVRDTQDVTTARFWASPTVVQREVLRGHSVLWLYEQTETCVFTTSTDTVFLERAGPTTQSLGRTTAWPWWADDHHVYTTVDFWAFRARTTTQEFGTPFTNLQAVGSNLLFRRQANLKRNVVLPLRVWTEDSAWTDLSVDQEAVGRPTSVLQFNTVAVGETAPTSWLNPVRVPRVFPVVTFTGTAGAPLNFETTSTANFGALTATSIVCADAAVTFSAAPPVYKLTLDAFPTKSSTLTVTFQNEAGTLTQRFNLVTQTALRLADTNLSVISNNTLNGSTEAGSIVRSTDDNNVKSVLQDNKNNMSQNNNLSVTQNLTAGEANGSFLKPKATKKTENSTYLLAAGIATGLAAVLVVTTVAIGVRRQGPETPTLSNSK